MSQNPICVLISDIHFSVANLELASESLLKACQEAERLDVPLVIAGDLLDGKAIIRGECANRVIDILSTYAGLLPNIYTLVGNHDLLSEKGVDHSLNFIKPYAQVVQHPTYSLLLGSYLIPYINNTKDLQDTLKQIPPGSRLIMHQGVKTAYMGEYVVDHTSLPPEAYAEFRVISGHYHRHQDIKCGPNQDKNVGTFTYIGTPYTTTFAEANDGPKGFQVMYEDGSLRQVKTGLRKHVILNRNEKDLYAPHDANIGDLVWVKLQGERAFLDGVDKQGLGEKLFGHANFKLDKIYNDSTDVVESQPNFQQTDEQLLDNIIESKVSEDHATHLKPLWRKCV